MDGNQSCAGFPWFQWPNQILNTKGCSRAQSSGDYVCHLCHNDTMCLTDVTLTLDPRTGYPLRAEFTDFGEIFTTISFEAVTDLPSYAFGIPPSCTQAAPMEVDQESESYAESVMARRVRHLG